MFQDIVKADHWIEFVGGPFDGHWQAHYSTVEQLASDVVWLVTEDAFEQLGHPRGTKQSPRGALTSVAFYELDVSFALPNYRYAGSLGARAVSDAIDDLD